MKGKVQIYSHIFKGSCLFLVLGFFFTSKVYMLVECLQKGNVGTEHSVRIAMIATLIC